MERFSLSLGLLTLDLLDLVLETPEGPGVALRGRLGAEVDLPRLVGDGTVVNGGYSSAETMLLGAAAIGRFACCSRRSMNWLGYQPPGRRPMLEDV